MTRRRRPWDRHRELADKDTASRWPSSAKSMFDGDGNADRPIYISQTSASSRSSYFTREGLRRARSFRRRPNRVHRTRLGRTAHTRQSNRGRGRMRDRTRSPEYDGSSSGVVSYAFSSCRDNKSNSPPHSRRVESIHELHVPCVALLCWLGLRLWVSPADSFRADETTTDCRYAE